MNIPFGNSLFFLLTLSAGSAMIVEACLILVFKKQITPLPSHVLAGLGGLLHSSRLFPPKQMSSKTLRAYAAYVSIFGPLVVVSSMIYLFTSIL